MVCISFALGNSKLDQGKVTSFVKNQMVNIYTLQATSLLSYSYNFTVGDTKAMTEFFNMCG